MCFTIQALPYLDFSPHKATMLPCIFHFRAHTTIVLAQAFAYTASTTSIGTCIATQVACRVFVIQWMQAQWGNVVWKCCMLILLLSVHEYRFTFIGTCMYISKATATASVPG